MRAVARGASNRQQPGNRMGERQPSRQFDRPIRVFFSYAHEDEALRDELSKHLSFLKRPGMIDEWHDRKIVPGDNWAEKIDDNINRADVILLLVSADFLASDYCYEIEMKRAMERHNAGEAVVIPIALRACVWKQTAFSKLQALPKNAEPVMEWPSRDKAFQNVAEGIEALVNAWRPGADASPPVSTRMAAGEDVPLHCDRGDQSSDFAMFLREHRAEKVLICGIPAKENDLPESLSERLTNTLIREHAERTWGASHGMALGKALPWPDPAAFEARRNRLLHSIYSHLKCDGFSAEPKGFAGIVSGRLEKAFVLRHTIRLKRWAEGERELLAWYLEFWAGVRAAQPAPQFILLLNLIHPEPSWRERWLGGKSDLRGELAALFPANGPQRLLDDLPCITYDHVWSWLDDFTDFSEADRLRECAKIFPNRNECRPMKEIEPILRGYHDRIQETRS
jgi:hypothetical protein